MIGKATSINKDDIMRIPYSHNKNDIIFSEAEKIIIEEIADKRKTEEIAVLNADITKFASVFVKRSIVFIKLITENSNLIKY